MIRRPIVACLTLGALLLSSAPALAQFKPNRSPADALKDAMASGRPYFTTDPSSDSVRFRERDGEPQNMSTDAFADFVNKRFSDRTVITGEAQQGWQVEYTAPDGKAYLWYPGNERLVVGRWRVKTDSRNLGGEIRRTVEVCFSYPDAYNPATGSGPNQEECQHAWFLLGSSGFSSTEWRPGDPFKLGGGVMPYQRTKADKPTWPQP